MTAETKEIVIQKEDAVFWLDRSGCWRNSAGKFRKKKIIDLFHQSIAKDDGGYFVCQTRDGVREKVYFRVEDTAFFVFEVSVNDGIILALNTGKRLPLDPGGLYAENDQLYLIHDGERVKFSERAMVRIAPFIEDAENHLVLHLKGETFPIPEARHMCINPSDAKEPA